MIHIAPSASLRMGEQDHRRTGLDHSAGDRRPKAKSATLLALALSLLALPAAAQFLTGAQLRENLDEAQAGTSFAKKTIAMGYIAGVYDLGLQREVCADRAIDSKESMAIVHRYLRAHPERLSENAAPLVLEALRQQFPCRR